MVKKYSWITVLTLCLCLLLSATLRAESISDVQTVVIGDAHTVALKTDGTVWTWGKNDDGQLGGGTTIERRSPNQVSGLSNVVSIAAGAAHTLAVRTDGSVWAWG